MKLIIVEGTDLVGKTTFLEMLSKTINKGFIMKNAFKPRNKEDSLKIREHYNYMTSCIRKCVKIDTRDSVIIMDRFYQSQMCYSFKRGKDEMTERYFKRLENTILQIKDLEVYYIWVTADLDIVEDRLLKRGDDYVGMNDLRTLADKYQKYFDKCTIRKTKIQNDGSLDELKTRVQETIRWLEF